jgi:hypothetical protein
MVGDGREWLAAQPLPVAAREQVTVALAMIDGIDRQMAPLDKELRAYARRQVGCKALMAHYGIGALTAVTILSELGDCTRFSSSRQAVRYAGLDITVYQSDQHRAPGHISRQGPPALRWALYEAAQVAAPRLPRSRLLHASRGACGRQPRVPVGRTQAAQTQLPHAARARGGGAGTRMSFLVRAEPLVTPMPRCRLPTCSRRHARVDGPERPSGRNASPSAITPSNIMSPAPEPTRGSWTEVRLGARAHNTTRTINRAHAPPANRSSTPTTLDPARDAGPLHK